MPLKIPPKFYNESFDHPIALTVGELKAILDELPDDLPVESIFSEGVVVVVYNHGKKDMHLEFEEVD